MINNTLNDSPSPQVGGAVAGPYLQDALADEAIHGPVEDGDQHIFLALEVQIDGAIGHTRAAGDLGYGGPVVAARTSPLCRTSRRTDSTAQLSVAAATQPRGLDAEAQALAYLDDVYVLIAPGRAAVESSA